MSASRVYHPRSSGSNLPARPTLSIKRYQSFKQFDSRILVATDIFGRGIDVERVNIVVNYDCPTDADSYLHRVGRAGRFGTKGLAITFVSSDADSEVLAAIQSRFEVGIPELPDVLAPETYSTSPLKNNFLLWLDEANRCPPFFLTPVTSS